MDPRQGRRGIEHVNPAYLDPNDPNFVHTGDVAIDIPHDRRHGPHRHRRQGSDAPSYHSSGDEDDHRNRWFDEEEQERQLQLLQSLPSRRLDQMVHVDSDHNRVRRKSSLRRRKTSKHHHHHHNTIRMRKSANVAEMIMHDLENDSDMDYVDSNVRDHMAAEALRGVTSTTLANKKRIKQDIHRSSQQRTRSKIGCFTSFKYSVAIWWGHVKQRMAEIRYSLRFWHGHLKKIEGHFGTGVTSYFRFLKWLFLINIPIFVLSLAFIVIPQMLYRFYQQTPTGYYGNFTGWELLTGDGWFENTELYYGYYTSSSVELPATMGHHYEMKFAYLCTCGAYYFITLLVLLSSMSKSYRKNYIEGSGEFNFYNVSKAFSGWDYGITSADAAALKHKALYNELKEFLSGFQEDTKLTCCARCGFFAFRLFTNLLTLAMIGGSGYLIWYISDTQSIKNDVPVLSELAMPLCISGINLIFPFAFSIIATYEKYTKPKYELYITMARTILLKATTLAVLIYFWFNMVDCHKLENTMEEISASRGECVECWETFMGEQIYMLVLVDFVFILIFTFISEFIRRLMSDYCCKALGNPEFNIGRNTLNLIYSQALIWLGSFYSPLLPLLQIIKLFVVFYVKRISVMQNCVPSIKPWRAARVHTIFLGLLLLAFFMTTFAVVWSIVSIQPSLHCGPYRGLNTSYEVVTNVLEEWKDQQEWLVDAIWFVTSLGFIMSILVALCVGVYYTRMVSKGHRGIIVQLKHQLKLEGQDKKFLLNMLQQASGKKNGTANGATPVSNGRLIDGPISPDSKHKAVPGSEGGRQFVKQRPGLKSDSPHVERRVNQQLSNESLGATQSQNEMVDPRSRQARPQGQWDDQGGGFLGSKDDRNHRKERGNEPHHQQPPGSHDPRYQQQPHDPRHDPRYQQQRPSPDNRRRGEDRRKKEKRR